MYTACEEADMLTVQQHLVAAGELVAGWESLGTAVQNKAFADNS